MTKNVFYTIVIIFLIGITALLASLAYSNKKASQEAATTTQKPSPLPTAKKTPFQPPDPMVYLPSTAVEEFFKTNPTVTVLDGFTSHLSHLPVTKATVSIKTCALTPAIIIVPASQSFALSNADSIAHTITYNSQTITVQSRQTQAIKNTIKSRSIETLSCDGTKNVGVIYSKP